MPAVTDRNPEQRVVEAAAVVAGHPAVVTGWAALAWRGGRWFTGQEDGPLDVPVMTSTFDRRPQPGLAYTGESWRAWEVEVVDGVRVATAASAVAFAARRSATHVEAVTVLDMAAYDDLVSLQEMHAMAQRCVGRTGVARLRAALEHADENTWSPQETPLRLLWLDSVGVRPLSNAPVFDTRGRHVATVDLIDPAAGVVGEYDGVVHLQAGRRRSDLRSEDRLRALGLDVVRFVGGMSDAERRRRLRAAYARAERRRADEQGWVVDLPPWWRSTATVDARRALGAEERERLLRYRSA